MTNRNNGEAEGPAAPVVELDAPEVEVIEQPATEEEAAQQVAALLAGAQQIAARYGIELQPTEPSWRGVIALGIETAREFGLAYMEYLTEEAQARAQEAAAYSYDEAAPEEAEDKD